MATDAVSLIKNDHRLLEGLFDDLRSGRGDRRALLVEVAARLAAHSHAEELKVYPALAEARPEEHGDVEHGAEEHHEAEQMLHRLLALGTNDPEFNSVLNRFINAVQHHVQEEENELLPALEQAVDGDRLEQLGQAFEEIRTKELEIAGIRSGPSRAGAAESGGTEMTREQLYERAKDAGISGRSHMTKDELAQALRDES